MTRLRGRTWLALVVLGALLFAGWAVLRRPNTDTPNDPRGPDGAVGRAPPDRAPRPLPTFAPGDGGHRGDGETEGRGPALDCDRPAGNAATVDGEGVTAERLCDRLTRVGGAGPAGVNRAQARLLLDQLIDATLVRRALAWERAAVSDAEVATALDALRVDAGPDPSLLREQLRERLELRKLASLRDRLAVSEQEVDEEIARGAPGIDRGQGVRVEGWIARVAPSADAGARDAAQHAAEGLARALQTESPEAAAARFHMARLAPFVLGANGVEPELEQAAFGLQAGQFTGAIATRVGWVVLRALGHVEGQRLTDVELRARVRQALENRKLQAARERLLASLRAAARVEFLVDL